MRGGKKTKRKRGMDECKVKERKEKRDRGRHRRTEDLKKEKLMNVHTIMVYRVRNSSFSTAIRLLKSAGLESPKALRNIGRVGESFDKTGITCRFMLPNHRSSLLQYDAVWRDLKEIGREGVDWFHLARNMDQWLGGP
jgi:hypothetical protein